ncbi:MAG: GGDEF domain-containing protein [Atopobiaceae bacterium]|nr:GGDEF domain-containing protein [Atopobiaceae bacterium]
MTLYTALTIVTLLFLMAGGVLITTNRTVDESARKVFVASLAVIFAEAVITWLVYTFVVSPEVMGFGMLIKAYMCVTFAVLPFIPVLMANVILPMPYAQILFKIMIAHAVFELADIFFNSVFLIDEANLFVSGPLHIVYVAVYSLSVAYLVFVSANVARAYQSASTLSTLAILACMGSGILIQLFCPRVYIAWTAVAMGIVLYFQLYSDMFLRTDALTKLLNRHAYDEFFANPRVPCAMVLIDVDSFKQINDTYGHEYGDVCLTQIAVTIRDAFGSAGRCYRTGGDEFTVIVTDKIDQISAMSSELERLLDDRRAQDGRMPTVSVGHAIAESASMLNDAVRAADATMYRNKRARKDRR